MTELLSGENEEIFDKAMKMVTSQTPLERGQKQSLDMMIEHLWTVSAINLEQAAGMRILSGITFDNTFTKAGSIDAPTKETLMRESRTPSTSNYK